MAKKIESLVHDYRKSKAGSLPVNESSLQHQIVLEKPTVDHEMKYLLVLLHKDQDLLDRVSKIPKANMYPDIDHFKTFKALCQPSVDTSISPLVGDMQWPLWYIADSTKPEYLIATGSTNDTLATDSMGGHPFPPTAGEGSFVYVVDDGIDCSHPEFEGKIIEHLYEESTAAQNHGTMVASCIGGNKLGVARSATIINVPVRQGDNGFFPYDIVRALDRVHADIKKKNRAGRAVVNMSWGSGPGGIPQLEEQQIGEAIERIRTLGVVCITAGGNNAGSQELRAADTFPAKLSYVLVIGAVDIKNHEADFSRYGDAVALYAPGSAVWVAKSRRGGKGLLYEQVDGTSFAAPLVSGVMGCVLAGELDGVGEGRATLAQEKLLETSVRGKITPCAKHYRSLHLDGITFE